MGRSKSGLSKICTGRGRFAAMFPALVVAGLMPLPSALAQKVAVVNVPVVSEKYRKTVDLESQFDAIRTRLKEERNAMQDRLERAKRSLQEELKPGTNEYNERRKQVAMIEAEINWFVEVEGQRIEQGLASSLASIFDDIQKAAAQVAEAKGVDIVIAADQLPKDTPENPNQVKQQILLQKVIYWKPHVDITEDVIAKLNAGYTPAAGEAKPKP